MTPPTRLKARTPRKYGKKKAQRDKDHSQSKARGHRNHPVMNKRRVSRKGSSLGSKYQAKRKGKRFPI